MSLPADNFYAFKDSIEVYAFMKESIEYCNRARRSFLLKLTIKVRDKIVADGLVDKTFDVTNIGIHLKARIQRITRRSQYHCGRYAQPLRERDWSFYKRN
jgi:predicted sulfurtransferase